jgi:hypothetical protein
MVPGMTNERGPAFRDGIPPWGWLALVLARIWALVPLLLLAAGIWWWTRGGSQQAPRWVRHAVQHARATADSTLGR